MSPNSLEKRKQRSSFLESAVTENIGAILLVSVAVIAVTGIGVYEFSQPVPEEVPSVHAIISNDSNIVYLTHEGGDSLRKADLRVYVDGVDVTNSITFPEDGTWSLGDQLVYVDSVIPGSVSIVYTSGASSSSVIAGRSLSDSGGGTGSTSGSGTNSFYINASAGVNGTISPYGSIPVAYWESKTFTVTPAFGYHTLNVLVDGASVGAVPTYTFSSIMASHTISALFAPNTYYINASAGANGSISPSGSIPLSFGESRSFSITPNTGFQVSNVVVDNSSMGPLTGYQFSAVSANHTISAAFTPLMYTITAVSVGSGGTVIPNGTVNVTYGGTASFSIQPSTGNITSNVIVDGVSKGAISSYTFSNITSNHTLSATFTVRTYAINATAGTGGSISPSSAIVNYGGSQTFTITPNSGYYLDSVSVDGSNVGYVSTYTFSNVTANHTISAVFTQTQTFTAAYLNTAGSCGCSYIRGGYFQKDTYMQFAVTGSNSYIWIGGTYYSLPIGSTVRLTLNSNQTGDIYIHNNYISSFDLSSVTLSVNGATVKTGTVSAIWVSSYSNYRSTLTLVVPVSSNPDWTDFNWNGNDIIPSVDDNSLITLINLGPKSGDLVNADVEDNHVYYDGGSQTYTLVITLPVITSISPTTGYSGDYWADYTIYGSQFAGINSGDTQITVILQKSGASNITAFQAYPNSDGTRITGHFNLQGATKGTYNLIVTNRNGGSATLQNAYTVY